MMKKLYTRAFKNLFLFVFLLASVAGWGQTVSVNDQLLSETFGNFGSSSTTFAASTMSSYDKSGSTTYVAADKNLLTFSGANAMYNTGTATNMTSGHVWLNKSTTGYLQISGIPIYNAKKIQISFSQTGSGNVDVYANFGLGETKVGGSTAAGATITIPEFSTSGTTLTLKFQRQSNTNNLRIDNIKVTVTEVATTSGYTITVNQATGGTISPGTSVVNGGENIFFTADPISCYTFSNWVVDGANVGNANPYTFTNVTANHTITAVYNLNTYAITASAGANGSIYPSGVASVNCGSTQSYTITPAVGYAVDDVLVDGVSVGAVTSYTFTNVTAVHTISASFKVYAGPCFEENFNTVGGSTTTTGSGTAWTGNANFPDAGNTRAYQGGQAIRLGSSSNGILTSKSLTEVSGNVTVKLDVKGWTTVEGTVNVTLNSITQNVVYTATIADPYENKTVTFTNVPAGSILLIEATKRAFIDNIQLFCTPSTPKPEINLKQNTTDIASSTGEYNFDNQQVSTSSASITFTIENTGNADLTVGAITKSGGNAGDFTIDQSSTVSSVSGPGTTTFTVSFTPSGTGVRSTTISIPNNDADEAPYTFTVKGNGTYSALSTIVDNTNYSPTSPEFNIDTEYINFTDNSATSTGKFIPMKLKIMDGPDSDDKNTILTGIKFTVTDLSAANRLAMIKTAILTTSGGTPIATATKVGNELVFSGMSGNSVTAIDVDGSGSGEKIIHLRVSIDETQVIDKTKLIFKVTSATSDPTGSSFAAADGGGAQSDATSTSAYAARNRLNVTATKLFFSTVTDGAINTNLSAFTISATDIYNRTDSDVNGVLTITTSGTGITGNTGFSLANGTASVGTVQFNTVQSSITLSANDASLNGTSNAFSIIDVPVGTYETTGPGTWPSGGASDATWRRMTVSGWTVSTPAANTTSLLVIKHAVASRTSFAAASPHTNMIVENGGSFNDAHNSTFGSLLVKSGGTFTVSDPGVDVSSTGTLTVESGGKFVINSSTLNHADGLFAGTENFKTGSTVEVKDYDNDSTNGDDDLIESTNPISTNTEGFYFGNLTIDFTPSSANEGKPFTLVGVTGNHKLCSGDLTVINNNAAKQVLLTNVNANVEIGGDLIVKKNNFGFASSSSALTHIVKGNIEVNGSDAVIDLNSTNGSGNVWINLLGNLKGVAGVIKQTDQTEGGVAFVGALPQVINIADAVDFNRINVEIRNGADVSLDVNNLKLNNGSTLTVKKGGIFNFGFNGTSALQIKDGSSGSNKFTSESESTLIITSADGLYGNWNATKFPAVTVNDGNLNLPKTNRTINTLGTFWYIGKGDQKTGDAPNSTLSTTSNTKTVIADLADNNKTLILDVPFGVSDIGLLDIRRGKVLETTDNYIFGSTGGLKMEPGTKYKIVKGDATEQTTEGSNGGTFIPRMRGTYTINGGEIELAGTGASNSFQTLRGSRDYNDLTFSGEGLKTLSNGTSEISGLISIMNGTTLDGKSFTVGKSSTDLLMDTNSLFKTGGSGTKPDAGGDYVLNSTSAVEFQNDSATKIRITPYENMVVSGSNVEPGGLNLLVNQNTVVTSTGKLTVPETLDNENPYVVTAKKGIQIAEGGEAIFKNNAILMQEKDAVNTGNITMERKATVPSVQYNYWSSPVKDQPLYSLYPGIPDNKVMVYNSANDRFTVLPTSSNPKSVFAKGYSIKGSSNTDYAPALTAKFVGEPHNETTAGITSMLLSTAGSNYNLIGNPYPSNLNLLELFADGDNNGKFYNVTSGPDIETPTAYFWDNTSNTDLTQQGSGYVNMNYALLNLSTGIGTPAPRLATTGKKPNGIVKPGQGFIMRAAESGGSLTFKNTHRTTLTKPSGGSDGVYYKANEATTDKFWLTLTTPNQMNVVIALAYHPEAENSFERFDSMIFSEAVTENFYSLSSDARKLAIQSRKGGFNNEDKIPLGIKSSETGLQKISLESKYGVFENQPIYLKDKLLNTVVNLSEMPYEFTSVEGVDQNRFEIVYKPATVLATDNGIKEKLTVYRNANDFIVKSKHSRIDEVEVYDVSGRLIIKVKGGSDELRIDASSYISGTYVLKIKCDEKTVTKKILK